MASNTEFLVRKDDLRTWKIESPPLAALAPGQVRLAVDHFAFTSNNVTYGAFGDAMHYWDFFPAAEGWGRIPVWGFADVVESLCEGVKVGERFYGYYPMATHVVLEPARLNPAGFVDGAAHRAQLHAVYNHYLRTSADPGYSAEHEALQMLLRPLFITSFLIDDFLADNDFFGAKTVIVSSASSKTAYGTAFCLSLRGRDAVEVIGLTSANHRAYVESLGCYHQVFCYDEIATLPADKRAIYVDMAGNGKLRSQVHHHFNDQLAYSCAVGGTHWDASRESAPLPGPRPTLFFAPAQIKKRSVDWGPAGVQERVASAWRAFMVPAGKWMRVVKSEGADAASQVYLAMLDGRARPEEGHILSLRSR